MSGLLIRHCPQFDGTESIGVWVDVAWSVYLEMGSLSAGIGGTSVMNELWDDLMGETDENGKPTPQEWGASERAQRGQEAMLAMFGGGMAPAVGEEL